MTDKLQIYDCVRYLYFGTPLVNLHHCQLHVRGISVADISGRGGQSALRFARLRMEKRHNYVRKVAEVATTLFITNDKPNIAGIILAGSADFKTELSQSDMFDPVGFTIFEIADESVLLYSAMFLIIVRKWPLAGRILFTYMQYTCTQIINFTVHLGMTTVVGAL